MKPAISSGKRGRSHFHAFRQIADGKPFGFSFCVDGFAEFPPIYAHGTFSRLTRYALHTGEATMEILIALLILAIVVVVAIYVIDLLPLPPPIPVIAKLIIGVVALIYLLRMVLPAVGGGKLF